MSEYGVNYHHTFSGFDERRVEWLKTIHDAFDEFHVSSTFWQYKDLITPWVNIPDAFGIWMHYYDKSTISGIENGKVIYSREDAQKAAVSFKVDDILNQYFIEKGSLKEISMIGNQSLIKELKRYFNTAPLNIELQSSRVVPNITITEEKIIFKSIENLKELPVSVFDTEGKILGDTVLAVSGNKAELPLKKLSKGKEKIVLIKYGKESEHSLKVLLP